MKELTGLEWVVFIICSVSFVGYMFYFIKDGFDIFVSTYKDEEENRDEGQ